VMNWDGWMGQAGELLLEWKGGIRQCLGMLAACALVDSHQQASSVIKHQQKRRDVILCKTKNILYLGYLFRTKHHN
jgi:hypothetical protein